MEEFSILALDGDKAICDFKILLANITKRKQETTEREERQRKKRKELIKGNFKQKNSNKRGTFTWQNWTMKKMKLELEMLKQIEIDKHREHEQKILEVELETEKEMELKRTTVDIELKMKAEMEQKRLKNNLVSQLLATLLLSSFQTGTSKLW